MAALDKRLQAHQEAFSLWRELYSEIYSSSIRAKVTECYEWWDKNCLYLEPSARQAFTTAVVYADGHNSLVKSGAGVNAINESMQKIRDFPNILFEAMKLPTLNGDERRRLDSETEKHAG
jgi:hypothetical protein